MKKLLLPITVFCMCFMSNIVRANDRGWATSIAWSPHGETIAIGSNTGLWLFNTDFNEIGHVETPELEGYPPNTMDWSADSGLIALALNTYKPYYGDQNPFYAGEFPILVIDVNKREIISRIEMAKLTSTIRWHPQENLLLAGDYYGKSYVVDALTGEVLFTYRESYDKLGNCCNTTKAVCWLRESIAAIVTLFEVYVVDVLEDKTVQRFESPLRSDLFRIAACDDNRAIISNNDYQIDLRSKTINRIFSLDTSILFSDYWFEKRLEDIAYSPDGSRIATNGNASLCRAAVFDGHSHELLAEVKGSFAYWGNDNYRDSIAWHPDGSQFAMVGQFDIRVWDAESYELLQRIDGFGIPFNRSEWTNAEMSEELARIVEAREKCPALPDSMLFSG